MSGRQYIGDMPNSDLRQMMMTVDTNFWGALFIIAHNSIIAYIARSFVFTSTSMLTEA